MKYNPKIQDEEDQIKLFGCEKVTKRKKGISIVEQYKKESNYKPTSDKNKSCQFCIRRLYNRTYNRLMCTRCKKSFIVEDGRICDNFVKGD